jgi:hypothetical protein
MHDDQPHVSFRLTPELLAQVQTLAQRHDQSLSQLIRDSLTLLLADPTAYLTMLSDRVLECYKMPTPEQARASQQLIDAAMLTDLSGLIAACTPPRP